MNFLDLPAELRCMIYHEYVESWSMIVRYDKQSDRFTLSGRPNNALLTVCKVVKDEYSEILKKKFSGKLQLKDVRVHRKGKFGFQSSLEVVATMGIDQVLSQVHTVEIENGTSGMLVLLPWYKFPRLRQVELVDALKVNPFAVGRVSKYWPFDSIDDASGECQICGILGYDAWTCVPTEIAQGKVKVISVRRGFASGACLKATVEYKADRGEFIERICEDLQGGWKWTMSGAGSF